MSKPLATHGFKWMNEQELEGWKNFSCILEVDLEYSESLHDSHNDYPLAPETVTVNNVEKLIPNLRNKNKYVVHCENKIVRTSRFENHKKFTEVLNLKNAPG